MNRRSLIGLAVAIIVILISTSVIVFASQSTEKSTRNSNSIELITSKSNTNAQIQSIGNNKAVEIAKKALKHYLGIDIEDKIKSDGLETKIYASDYDEIMVLFQKGNDINSQLEASVTISKETKEAKIVNWLGYRQNKEISYDEAQVKKAAENYIKEKGLGKNLKNITASNVENKYGRFTAYCNYKDGSSIIVEFNGKDYSPVLYSTATKLTTELQHINISDTKAVEMAKEAFKNYLGVDMDKRMQSLGLQAKVSSLYAKVSDSREEEETDVYFVPKNKNHEDYGNENSVTISGKDGSIQSVDLRQGPYIKQTCQYDENKLKDVAKSFLKNKGLRTDVKNFKIDKEKKAYSIITVVCEYPDGSRVFLEYNVRDYSVIYFRGYGNFR